MGIYSIRIVNYKSLKNISFSMEKNLYHLYCILGKNGAGKSTFIDAISYFYENLSKISNYNKFVIDKMNPYVESMEIEIIYDLESFDNKKSNKYIDDILYELKPYLKNNKILIRLTQYKDGIIKWFPKNKNILKYISRMFPFYIIDTRFISLQNWSSIWEIVSDLSITNAKLKNEDINIKLDNVFQEVYGNKYSKVLERVNKILAKEKITVNNLDYNDRFKNMLFTRFGGSEFINDENNLEYYSDGINSLKYIKLILDLITMLSETGWKKPLIVIDEPEIGLHPQLIDELIECLTDNASKGTNIILATHSTQIITGLIKNNINTAIYRINKPKNYSSIEKMKDIIKQEDKFIISNKETECYFSNAIVCVEGKTEIQILLHPRIVNLFNNLKKITFYPYNSDNQSMKLIHPENVNFTIPHLNVVDMDKILKYKPKKQKFKFNSDILVNPLVNKKLLEKQNFMYPSEEKFIIDNLRIIIERILKYKSFEQDSQLYYIKDSSFKDMLETIKLYCLEYNVYPVSTTIEGCIVNDKNINIVLEWINTIFDDNYIRKLNELLSKDLNIEKKQNNNYRLNIIRLILNGKLDILKTIKEVQKENLIEKNDAKKILELNQQIGGKTKGWVINFINYYFDNYIDNLSNIYEKEEQFSSDFKELYKLLQIISNVII